jgi:iron(III) transport system ATP-binding protein
VTRGEILLNGRLVSGPGVTVPPEERRIGMVFQDYALFPHLSVAENIGFGLHGVARSERARRVEELIEAVGLSGHAHKHPHELSGGQQQRVALARALAPQPDLLLLDEPFSNLDVDLRERLSVDVREIIRRTGTTAILVTHDQHEAFAFADAIGIMHEGRIEQWDTAYELYHRPATRFIADFVGQGVFVRGVTTGTHRLATELGDLDTNHPLPAPLGEPLDVLVRPDDIVHDDLSPWQAEVASKAFRGADFLYTLTLASGTQVLSLVPSHHNHAPGAKIGIRLAIDHVVAFPVA